MIDRIIFRTTLVAVMFSLASCSGNSTTIQKINSQTQQLLDLKEAHSKGVITDEEFDRTRARILKQQ
jgi:uncharacterized membrane protein